MPENSWKRTFIFITGFLSIMLNTNLLRYVYIVLRRTREYLIYYNMCLKIYAQLQGEGLRGRVVSTPVQSL